MNSTINTVTSLKECALPRLNQKEYERYKNLILNTKDNKVINHSLKELIYFYERFLGFGSNVMHHVNDSESMFVLSDFYLPLSKNKFVLEESFIPSTSTEAISNLFLVFSETNIRSYLLGLDLLFNELHLLDNLTSVVNDVDADQNILEVFQKVSKHFSKSGALLENLQHFYKDLSEEEELKVQKDLFLLMDTFNNLVKDLIAAEDKYKIEIA